MAGGAKIKAAIYIRVSTDMQAKEINYSLESLKSHLQQSHSSIREMWALLSNDEKRMFVTTLVK
ncbi:MAG: hypothetical protein QM208_06475, partial [Bacillota bacterium]|nr:hypothetical protein [Bacillota bacterium]